MATIEPSNYVLPLSPGWYIAKHLHLYTNAASYHRTQTFFPKSQLKLILAGHCVPVLTYKQPDLFTSHECDRHYMQRQRRV